MMEKVFSPFDNRLIKEIHLSDAVEAEEALERAYRLSQDKNKLIPKYERIRILEKTIEIMTSQRESLAKIAVEEGGKPLRDTNVEVDRAIQCVKIAIGNIESMAGEEIPMGSTLSSANRIAYTILEPVGVVMAISAFNHPLNLTLHQVIPAVATGCPVIIKPSRATPLSCLNFVDILYQAGLPEQWCQVIVCDKRVAGDMAADPRVSFFSFIGSAKVGWSLRSKLAPGTRCAMEHGGVAPVIVEEDADMELLLPALSKGGFYHAGQVCVSVQRVFVHQNIAQELTSRLSDLVKQLKVGDPLLPDTDVGPLISAKEVDRVDAWVKEARDKGGQILCGGKKISESCYEPTLILNPPDDARVSTEEIFGPVVCIYSYQERSEAITRANSLPFSFQAAVFTENLNTALDTVKHLKAEAVMVNDHTAFRVDWMPFGGSENSGLGSGGIGYSMRDMTRKKLMVIKYKVP